MRVYPVVHINSPDVALEQSAAALNAGADGVYLIDHRSPDETQLYETFSRLDAERPDAFIGLNILPLEPAFALRSIKSAIESGFLSREPDALWADSIIEGRNGRATGEAKRYRDEHDMRTRILGGVAFKYTATYTDDPERAARLTRFLRGSVDTVTTSGPGTGKPAPVDKIAAMKRAAEGDLAVASGVDAYNMADYAGLVDEILVASSIETAPYSGIFEKDKLADLIRAARELAANREQ